MDQPKNQYPENVHVLDSLRKNCHIGKHRHFSASDRTNRAHIWIGLPAVIISVVLGSTFFVLISKEIPIEAKWAGAFAGLTAAVLGAIQTFFNFQKTSEGHRTVANQYLAIQRDCAMLIADYCDGLVTLERLTEKLTEMNDIYQQVNKAAEGLRTNEQTNKTTSMPVSNWTSWTKARLNAVTCCTEKKLVPRRTPQSRPRNR